MRFIILELGTSTPLLALLLLQCTADFGTCSEQGYEIGCSSLEPALLFTWLEEEEKVFPFGLSPTIPSLHLSSLSFPESK